MVCPHCDYHFRINARTRIAQLFDEGSFEEFFKNVLPTDPLNFVDTESYADRLKKAHANTGLDEAVITGIAKVDGHRLAVAVMDFDYMGGSMGSVVGEKVTRIMEKALALKLPVLAITSSGGARMQESAFLLSGITIEVVDEEDSRHAKFHYENGLINFVEYINEDKKELHKATVISGSKDKIDVKVAFQYTESYSENIVSFVNNVKTSDGGTHEVGFKTAITKVLNDYARTNNYLKKDKSFDGSDVREGLTAVISVQIPEDLLQFEGQTKAKLGTPEAPKPAILPKKTEYTTGELLNIFDTVPDFEKFTFDGQTIVLEDYTEIKPDKIDELKELIKTNCLMLIFFSVISAL